MFSVFQIAAMAFSAVVSVGVPLLLAVLWRKGSHAPWRAAVVGAAMFFLFALVLEQLVHALVLQPGGFVLTHNWAYVVYGCLAAGIFEETGRLVGFRFLLKGRDDKTVGVMYGIGHGGIEAILLGGVAALGSLVVALQYNAGALTGDALAAIPAALDMPASSFWVIGMERMIALCLHIALSVLVFQAVKRPGKRWMYPVAILLHAGIDAFAALYQVGILGLWRAETMMALFTALICVWVFRLYRRDTVSKENLESVEQTLK